MKVRKVCVAWSHQRSGVTSSQHLSLKRPVRAYLVIVACLSACAPLPSKPAVRSTKIDPIQATPDYWLNQPAVAFSSNADYYRLIDACKTEIRDRFFTLDREDIRDGSLSTLPMISKQFFEPWRSDVVTVNGIAISSLNTVRRTIRFQIQKDPQRGYVAEPKVLVEQFASVEHRITTITEYHEIFGGIRNVNSSEVDSPTGSTLLPSDYWFSIGRDNALEKSLAASIQGRLR